MTLQLHEMQVGMTATSRFLRISDTFLTVSITSFTLRACPKLQYLECGKRCFKRAREFHLKSLRLKSVPRRFAGAEASEAGVQVIHEGLGCRAGE